MLNVKEINDIRYLEALLIMIDCVTQFGYSSIKKQRNIYTTGGLSTLASLFEFLDIDEGINGMQLADFVEKIYARIDEIKNNKKTKI